MVSFKSCADGRQSRHLVQAYSYLMEVEAILSEPICDRPITHVLQVSTNALCVPTLSLVRVS